MQIKKFFQVALGVDRCHTALRIILIVPDMRIKTIGEEDDRSAAVFLLQKIGVELCLLSAFGHIHASTLSLKHGKRLAIITKENVVGITHLALVRHTVQLNLVQPILPFDPSRFFQHEVDVDLSGLILRQIQRLRYIGLLLLGATSGQFILERLVFLDQFGNIDIIFRNKGKSLIYRQRKKGFVKLLLGVFRRVEIRHAVEEHK